MDNVVEAQRTRRASQRVIFQKEALAIFDGKPQVNVKTFDINATGIGVSSPVHSPTNSSCWLRLKVPTSPESDQVFIIQTKVIYSVYSKDSHAFKTGLMFINPDPALVGLINGIIQRKSIPED